ncbi:MAG: ATP-dependent helicase [Saprospiraceae bacterium]
MQTHYLDALNPAQRQAATAVEGPVLIVAGPGSGKTRVLTYRIAYLLEQHIPPREILALTFTNKSAREMKARIAQVVGNRANEVWAGTFHAVFARILRMEAEKIGYPQNFTIYDTEDSKNLLGAIVKEMNLDKANYAPNVLLGRISAAKTALVTPALYAGNENLMRQDRAAGRPFFYLVYQQYAARCKRSGAMDFDDLLYRFYELLHRNPDGVLEKYRQKFRYLMIDEFQDTNPLQYAIGLKLVKFAGSPHNICVVGDDAQSIYGFRGATIQNILDFEQDFKPHGIRVFKLEQNYRSTRHIVQSANMVIRQNKNQIPKEIISEKGDGHKIRIVKAVSDTEEGKLVVDTILEQKNRFHLHNKDIAILYRTNAQSRIFEEYLLRYNLPYRVFGGQSFYQRKEVKDLLAYLRLAVNPLDDEALRRVINYPKRNIGDTTVDKIAAAAAAQGIPLWEGLCGIQIGGRTQQAIDAFVALVNDLRALAQTANAYDVALSAAERSGIVALLRSDTSTEGLSRLENLGNLLGGIKSFTEEDQLEQLYGAEEKSLAAYLQNIALITDLDDGDKTTEDHVTLMSVHSAKGLEFKSVFLAGLEENLFPSFMAMDSLEGTDEERRLFYVAITRAEQILTLTYAASRYKFGQVRYNEPSRFLGEIPEDCLESPAGARRPTKGNSPDNEPAGARVSGNFSARPRAINSAPVINPQDFNPSPSDKIQTGMKVLHLHFGEGKVLSIDGAKDNRVATIYFREIDQPERRIMLKFAKLQILD